MNKLERKFTLNCVDELLNRAKKSSKEFDLSDAGSYYYQGRIEALQEAKNLIINRCLVKKPTGRK